MWAVQAVFATILLLITADGSAVDLPALANITNQSASMRGSAERSLVEVQTISGVSAADVQTMKSFTAMCAVLSSERLAIADCILEKCNQQWSGYVHLVMVLGPDWSIPGIAWVHGRKEPANEPFVVLTFRTGGTMEVIISRMQTC